MQVPLKWSFCTTDTATEYQTFMTMTLQSFRQSILVFSADLCQKNSPKTTLFHVLLRNTEIEDKEEDKK